MKIFSKIYDFLCDYEDLLKIFLFLFLFYFLGFLFILHLEKHLAEEKAIILNTKDYVVYDNCREFDNKFYCYNIEKD